MSNKSDAPTPPSSEDRRQHLIFIQEIVARMANTSAMVKGWSLTVVTAVFGVAIGTNSWKMATLGIGVALIFGYLDAHYLGLERSYRRLFNATINSNSRVALYELDWRFEFDTPPKRSVMPPWRVLWSWSILPFYGSMIAIGLVIVCVYAIK